MKKHIVLSSIIVSVLLLPGCGQQNGSVSPAINRDAEIEANVEKILKGMDLTSKVGQMIQLTSSTVTAQDGASLDPDKLQLVIGQMKVGSILNTFWDQAQSRE